MSSTKVVLSYPEIVHSKKRISLFPQPVYRPPQPNPTCISDHFAERWVRVCGSSVWQRLPCTIGTTCVATLCTIGTSSTECKKKPQKRGDTFFWRELRASRPSPMSTSALFHSDPALETMFSILEKIMLVLLYNLIASSSQFSSIIITITTIFIIVIVIISTPIINWIFMTIMTLVRFPNPLRTWHGSWGTWPSWHLRWWARDG